MLPYFVIAGIAVTGSTEGGAASENKISTLIFSIVLSPIPETLFKSSSVLSSPFLVR